MSALITVLECLGYVALGLLSMMFAGLCYLLWRWIRR